MARLTHITGLKNVLANLKKAGDDFEKKIERGLTNAGLFTQRESQKIVPVDTGSLRGGAETKNVGGRGIKTDIVVVYKADYAMFVHEDLDAKHKAGKTAKYLESVVRTHKEKLFSIIAKG